MKYFAFRQNWFKLHTMKNTFIISSLLIFVLSAFHTGASIEISISNPTATSVFKPMDTIRIKAKVSSTEALHNVNIKVITTDQNQVLFSKNIHTHGISADINEYFVNPLLEKKELKLIIQTTGHDNNESASKELLFSTSSGKKRK